MKKRSSSVRIGVVKSPSDTDIPKYTEKKKSQRFSSSERHNRKSLVNSSDRHELKVSSKPSYADIQSFLTPYDLVLAFERELLSGNLGFNPLSQEQINLLTAKETVKVKSKGRRKTILENSRGNSISAEALGEWNNLDMAKKERRVLEIIESREDLRKLLTESALEAFPIPKKIKVWNH